MAVDAPKTVEVFETASVVVEAGGVASSPPELTETLTSVRTCS
ncbi:hypothetical protein [Gryllotalpicola sp.]|nr:hypothetical protein [Gryllotalpicola sp.]